MKILRQIELDQIWTESQQAGQVCCYTTEFELNAGLPSQVGQGSAHHIWLREGLSIQILNGELAQALTIERQHSEQFPLTLKFYLAGHSRVVTPNAQDIDADYEECCGYSYLYWLPELRELEHYESKKPISIVYINLELDYLKSFSQDWGSLPLTLQHVIDGTPKQRLYQACGKMPASTRTTVRQILNCPYSGFTKQVYLESKALELFAMQLMHCQDSPPPFKRLSTLQSADIERLHQAKALLSQTLNQPPSVSDLAQQVGLNRRKLHEGFQQLFGTTPFGMLRNDRLAQAKNLLMDSELSIESVAKQVGYRDRSAFAVAFRKQFGVNPKTYQLQQHSFQRNL